jgi:hypothetical protein
MYTNLESNSYYSYKLLSYYRKKKQRQNKRNGKSREV